MKNKITNILTIELSNTYTIETNEKSILYESMNNCICNRKRFVYIATNANKYYLEFTTYNDRQEKRFHIILVSDSDKDYHDVTDFIPKKLLYKYMEIYVNIKGI